MSRETDLEARDVRAGYIEWCRGELPRGMAGEKFDQFIKRIKADAVREARDQLGVDISDNESEWWDGYRQGQRRQFAVLAEHADRIEEAKEEIND